MQKPKWMGNDLSVSSSDLATVRKAQLHAYDPTALLSTLPPVPLSQDTPRTKPSSQLQYILDRIAHHTDALFQTAPQTRRLRTLVVLHAALEAELIDSQTELPAPPILARVKSQSISELDLEVQTGLMLLSMLLQHGQLDDPAAIQVFLDTLPPLLQDLRPSSMIDQYGILHELGEGLRRILNISPQYLNKAIVYSSLVSISVLRAEMHEILDVIELLLSESFDIDRSLCSHFILWIESAHGPNRAIYAPPVEVTEFESDLWVWGRGESGRLGLDSNTTIKDPCYVPAFHPKRLRALDTFANHSLAIDVNGKVYSWGKGDSGRLGLGDAKVRKIPHPIEAFNSISISLVACGLSHSLFVSDEGVVYSCGDGGLGRLGHGNTLSKNIPAPIDALLGIPITHVYCGAYHSFARDSSDCLYAWGKNKLGELGIGDFEHFYASPVKIPHKFNILHFCSGWAHNLLITTSGELYSWGSGYENSRPVLGHGSVDPEPSPRLVTYFLEHDEIVIRCGAGWDHSIALCQSGAVYSWGDGLSGKLGHGDSSSQMIPKRIEALANLNIVFVAGGSDHSAVIDADGQVYCWGGAEYMQLASGTGKFSWDPLIVSQLQDTPITKIYLGDKHTMAISGTPFNPKSGDSNADIKTSDMKQERILEKDILTEKDITWILFRNLERICDEHISTAQEITPTLQAPYCIDLDQRSFDKCLSLAEKIFDYVVTSEDGYLYSAMLRIVWKLIMLNLSRASLMIDRLVLSRDMFDFKQILDFGRHSLASDRLDLQVQAAIVDTLISGITIFFPTKKTRYSFIQSLLNNDWNYAFTSRAYCCLSEEKFMFSLVPDEKEEGQGGDELLEILNSLVLHILDAKRDSAGDLRHVIMFLSQLQKHVISWASSSEFRHGIVSLEYCKFALNQAVAYYSDSENSSSVMRHERCFALSIVPALAMSLGIRCSVDTKLKYDDVSGPLEDLKQLLFIFDDFDSPVFDELSRCLSWSIARIACSNVSSSLVYSDSEFDDIIASPLFANGLSTSLPEVEGKDESRVDVSDTADIVWKGPRGYSFSRFVDELERPSSPASVLYEWVGSCSTNSKTVPNVVLDALSRIVFAAEIHLVGFANDALMYSSLFMLKGIENGKFVSAKPPAGLIEAWRTGQAIRMKIMQLRADAIRKNEEESENLNKDEKGEQDIETSYSVIAAPFIERARFLLRLHSPLISQISAKWDNYSDRCEIERDGSVKEEKRIRLRRTFRKVCLVVKAMNRLKFIHIESPKPGSSNYYQRLNIHRRSLTIDDTLENTISTYLMKFLLRKIDVAQLEIIIDNRTDICRRLTKNFEILKDILITVQHSTARTEIFKSLYDFFSANDVSPLKAAHGSPRYAQDQLIDAFVQILHQSWNSFRKASSCDPLELVAALGIWSFQVSRLELIVLEDKAFVFPQLIKVLDANSSQARLICWNIFMSLALQMLKLRISESTMSKLVNYTYEFFTSFIRISEDFREEKKIDDTMEGEICLMKKKGSCSPRELGFAFPLPHASSMNGMNFAFSFWFKVVRMKKGQPQLICLRSNNEKKVKAPAVVISEFGSKLCVIFSTSSKTDEVLTTNLSVKVLKWYHLVITADAKKISIYVNGVLDSTTELKGSIRSVDPQVPLRIGGVELDNYSKFDGRFATLSVFWRALLPEEVMVLYGRGIEKHATVRIAQDLISLLDEIASSSTTNELTRPKWIALFFEFLNTSSLELRVEVFQLLKKLLCARSFDDGIFNALLDLANHGNIVASPGRNATMLNLDSPHEVFTVSAEAICLIRELLLSSNWRQGISLRICSSLKGCEDVFLLDDSKHQNLDAFFSGLTSLKIVGGLIPWLRIGAKVAYIPPGADRESSASTHGTIISYHCHKLTAKVKLDDEKSLKEKHFDVTRLVCIDDLHRRPWTKNIEDAILKLFDIVVGESLNRIMRFLEAGKIFMSRNTNQLFVEAMKECMRSCLLNVVHKVFSDGNCAHVRIGSDTVKKLLFIASMPTQTPGSMLHRQAMNNLLYIESILLPYDEEPPIPQPSKQDDPGKQAKIELLMNIGFSAKACEVALKEVGWNENAAIDWLLANAESLEKELQRQELGSDDAAVYEIGIDPRFFETIPRVNPSIVSDCSGDETGDLFSDDYYPGEPAQPRKIKMRSRFRFGDIAQPAVPVEEPVKKDLPQLEPCDLYHHLTVSSKPNQVISSVLLREMRYVECLRFLSLTNQDLGISYSRMICVTLLKNLGRRHIDILGSDFQERDVVTVLRLIKLLCFREHNKPHTPLHVFRSMLFGEKDASKSRLIKLVIDDALSNLVTAALPEFAALDWTSHTMQASDGDALMIPNVDYATWVLSSVCQMTNGLSDIDVPMLLESLSTCLKSSNLTLRIRVHNICSRMITFVLDKRDQDIFDDVILAFEDLLESFWQQVVIKRFKAESSRLFKSPYLCSIINLLLQKYRVENNYSQIGHDIKQGDLEILDESMTEFKPAALLFDNITPHKIGISWKLSKESGYRVSQSDDVHYQVQVTKSKKANMQFKRAVSLLGDGNMPTPVSLDRVQSFFADDKVEFETIYEGRTRYFRQKDLVPFTIYGFRVRVIHTKTGGEGPWSNVFECRTAPDFRWEYETPRHDKQDLTFTHFAMTVSLNHGTERWKTILANQGYSEGFHQWELRVESLSRGYMFIGVASQETNLSTFCGGDIHGFGLFIHERCCYHARGKLRGGAAVTRDAIRAGDVLSFTIDFHTRTLVASLNGKQPFVLFNDLPQGVKYFPAVSLYHADDSITIAQDISALPKRFDEGIESFTERRIFFQIEKIVSDLAILYEFIENEGVPPLELCEIAYHEWTSWSVSDVREWSHRSGQKIRANISLLSSGIFENCFIGEKIRTDFGIATVAGVSEESVSLIALVDGSDKILYISPEEFDEKCTLITEEKSSFVEEFGRLLVGRNEACCWTFEEYLEKIKAIEHDSQITRYICHHADRLNVTPLQMTYTDVADALLNHMHIEIEILPVVIARFSILRAFNVLIREHYSYLDLRTLTSNPSLPLGRLRQNRSYIFTSTKKEALQNLLDQTTTLTTPAQDPYEDPPELRKISLSRHKAGQVKRSGNTSSRLKHLLFPQAMRALQRAPTWDLRRSYTHIMDDGQSRTFKVKFEGEGVVDNGGPYRECFHEFVTELFHHEPAYLPLFNLCPNGEDGQGLNQDKFLPNPSCTHLHMYEFFGRMMGIALRHKILLGISFPSLVWKRFVSSTPSVGDLEAVDLQVVHLVQEARACKDPVEFEARFNHAFTAFLSDGVTEVELVPFGRDRCLSWDNREEWTQLLLNARLEEGEEQVQRMLQGLNAVVPTWAFQMFTEEELERAFCGTPDFDVRLLQEVTVYEGQISATDPHIQHFWQVLREFDPDEKEQFVRFVWARSRLPARAADFDTQFKLQAPLERTLANPDAHLPQSHTCFFSLSLPAYSSKQVLREKLIYACANCATMDLDMKLQDEELYNYEAHDL